VGREGPIIQIGSSLGSTVGQFLRIPSARLKTLVGCGAGAGIAAAFNAPIAGALFAVEIILMDFAVAQFSPIVISSVMATVISHTFEGNFAAFRVPVYQLVSPFEIGLYFVLGALAGVVSFLFIKALYSFEHFFDDVLPLPEYVKPAIGGLGVGAIALLFPEIMGVGYDSINIALHGDMIWYLGAILVLVKILATSVTLGSGGSGGIFAPSLFMGAMLGSFFGSFVHHLFPDSTATAGAYALVAMGGLVAGTTRAPITAIIIVFELTNDYRIILPLMITCIISTILSSKFSRESIYTLKLLLRNIGIREGKEINVMEGIFVKGVFTRQFDAIPVTANFSQVVKMVLHGKDPCFPVVNNRGDLVGVLSIDDIKDHLFERDSLSSLLIAGDIAATSVHTVTPDEHCQDALEKMSLTKVAGIPVVENDHSRAIIGMIWRKDILEAYQKEIERRELTSTLASSITMKEGEEQVHFMEGYSITEMQPPGSFIGKSIGELDIRGRFGVDVLSVRNGKDGEKITALPGAAYVIRDTDLLIVAGEIRRIAVLKNLN
jgi:CIC family chloride channel protein